MPYNVVVTREAERILDRLPRDIRAACAALFIRLEGDPRAVARPMKGALSHLHRARIGGWRVLLHIDESAKIVRVTTIGRRGDVYKGART